MGNREWGILFLKIFDPVGVGVLKSLEEVVGVVEGLVGAK